MTTTAKTKLAAANLNVQDLRFVVQPLRLFPVITEADLFLGYRGVQPYTASPVSAVAALEVTAAPPPFSPCAPGGAFSP
jgi:hypothetical protein